MAEDTIVLGAKKKSTLMDEVKKLIPDGGNLNLCLTCGACSSGCPATGLEGLDPRKFLRMAALGMDDEILKSDWPWMCTMCQRCIYVCPMKIDIPQLIYNVRSMRPREERPKGILGSCDMALKNDSCSAMGASEEDFQFVVEDVLEEYREAQPEFAEMQAPVNKQGAELFLNQNSREPVTELTEADACGGCHRKTFRELEPSVHEGIASCTDCHGGPHDIHAMDDLASTMSPVSHDLL